MPLGTSDDAMRLVFGQFSVALSDKELDDLNSRKIWLTLAAGIHQTTVRKDGFKLDAVLMKERLILNRKLGRNLIASSIGSM